MTVEEKAYQKQQEEEQYDNMRDLYAQFIFKPGFKEEDFNHITKDLSINNLRSAFKEPERARELLKAFHILTNRNYFEPGKKEKLIGYREDGEPVYKSINILESKFPRTHHSLYSKWVSLVSTSLARDGHLMTAFKTTRFEKGETIEDKTEIAKRPINSGWGRK